MSQINTNKFYYTDKAKCDATLDVLNKEESDGWTYKQGTDGSRYWIDVYDHENFFLGSI